MYESIRYMHITFVFFKNNLVVHEEKITVKGALEKELPFVLVFDTNEELDSSFMINLKGQITQLPVF